MGTIILFIAVVAYVYGAVYYSKERYAFVWNVVRFEPNQRVRLKYILELVTLQAKPAIKVFEMINAKIK